MYPSLIDTSSDYFISTDRSVDWPICLQSLPATSLGNHEFDYGAAQLTSLMERSKFEWLGGNVKDNSTNQVMAGAKSTDVVTFTLPYIESPEVAELLASPPPSPATSTSSAAAVEPTASVLNGLSIHSSRDNDGEHVKLGLFGVCTELTPKLSWPGNSVRFEPIFQCAQAQVAHLRSVDNVDFIVGLTHTSVTEDVYMAENLGDVVALLGGHDHYPYAAMHANTLVFKCGSNAFWLGVLDLNVIVSRPRSMRDSSSFRERAISIYPSWQMINNTGYAPDPACRIIIDQAVARQEAEIAKDNPQEILIPSMEYGLDTRSKTLRSREAAAANMVADAMRSRGESDLAIINGGFIRGDKLYEEGSPLTKGDVLYELPFPKAWVRVNIFGKDLRLAVEQHLAPLPEPNGRFPHPSSNVRIRYDPRLPPLQRIVEFVINGEPVVNERRYSIVITEFMFMGGDELSGYTAATLDLAPKERMSACVSCYLAKLNQAHMPYAPHLESRIESIISSNL
jgi:2',3'-cyclic-nucleotide 2'-phosphodiesterase (5'-nucleotidase family)